MWALLRLPRFRGATHANDNDNRSRHRQVGLSGPRSGCRWRGGHPPPVEASLRPGVLSEAATMPGWHRGLRLVSLLVARAPGTRPYRAIDAAFAALADVGIDAEALSSQSWTMITGRTAGRIWIGFRYRRKSARSVRFGRSHRRCVVAPKRTLVRHWHTSVGTGSSARRALRNLRLQRHGLLNLIVKSIYSHNFKLKLTTVKISQCGGVGLSLIEGACPRLGRPELQHACAFRVGGGHGWRDHRASFGRADDECGGSP